MKNTKIEKPLNKGIKNLLNTLLKIYATAIIPVTVIPATEVLYVTAIIKIILSIKRRSKRIYFIKNKGGRLVGIIIEYDVNGYFTSNWTDICEIRRFKPLNAEDDKAPEIIINKGIYIFVREDNLGK
ncbi:hypothetical protein B0T20DRAFT_394362 [Sordaria brevicollis]|uniref:Uncharacterized protein n=1 Tax=Sordaria brevicollis TaxID=83679 RepID=A0AAE0UB31_SORBR|nr:hypothetical protein B0T20DRAFT_394362 [Sordaria brevicollis]